MTNPTQETHNKITKDNNNKQQQHTNIELLSPKTSVLIRTRPRAQHNNFVIWVKEFSMINASLKLFLAR